MIITGRNNFDNATQAELTREEINTIMWALYHYHHEKAKKLSDDLCGIESLVVGFDGRGKNAL